ncbi:MAG TPA: hypothetical protein VFO95_11285 [Gemmatimonadales bacterium]|nr:hypothetical protein [Gemmatimonadales bacterium]
MRRRAGGRAGRRAGFPSALSAFSALSVLIGCQTATTRPGFLPVPGSPTAEVRLLVPRATEVLAEALRSDSIPLKRVVEIDGVIESEWFSVPGYAVAGGRPLGPGIVRVRAWVDVGKPGHSIYTLETVYRVFADPSRDPRELEQPVSETHPASLKVKKVLETLLTEYGEPVVKADSAARAKPDTALTIDN